jgi:hypothetical protein
MSSVNTSTANDGREDRTVARQVFSTGNGVTCFEVGGEFYVYRGTKLVRVCPSIGMAREVAAGA